MAYSGILLFIYSLFFLPETLQNLKTNVNLKIIINNYITLFKNTVYIRFLSIKLLWFQLLLLI